MLGKALDTLLASLDGVPSDAFVVRGITGEGHELRVAWHAGDVACVDCVSVSIEVPEPPRGRSRVVLFRWDDRHETIAYTSLAQGAEPPEWKALELVPGGVRLSVKWPNEDAARTYDFHWLEPDFTGDIGVGGVGGQRPVRQDAGSPTHPAGPDDGPDASTPTPHTLCVPRTTFP